MLTLLNTLIYKCNICYMYKKKIIYKKARNKNEKNEKIKKKKKKKKKKNKNFFLIKFFF